jgi:hypothetical protein
MRFRKPTMQRSSSAVCPLSSSQWKTNWLRRWKVDGAKGWPTGIFLCMKINRASVRREPLTTDPDNLTHAVFLRHSPKPSFSWPCCHKQSPLTFNLDPPGNGLCVRECRTTYHMRQGFSMMLSFKHAIRTSRGRLRNRFPEM